jgi:hypothetical protein
MGALPRQRVRGPERQLNPLSLQATPDTVTGATVGAQTAAMCIYKTRRSLRPDAYAIPIRITNLLDGIGGN